MTTASRPRRRDQIIVEATPLFANRGYEGTSIRSIAQACGITEAAIYRHFKGKADLYAEVIRAKARQHDIAARLAPEAGRGSVADILRTAAEQIIALGTGDRELLRLMFSNSLEDGEVATVLFREIRLPFIEFVADELTRRIAAGDLVPVDPFITARCFVGMVMDCALNTQVWERITDAEFRAGDVVCNNVPIFARGLENHAPL